MSIVQAPLSVGEVVADKYRVDRIVGSGGMSIVVLAWHMELEQEVAIKVLHGPNIEGSDAAQRFRREARAAARIRSEHVSRVLDVGTLPSGAPFMVMEYLQGNDLADELARRGPLPIEEVVIYVLQAIEALAEAHAAGIVHRDLKPENLFLAVRADGSRIIKVLDFGISKSISPSSISELSLTKTASFVGSPLYMSPEQMRSSRSVDSRTDIWSLGAILYEAVSGKLPYAAESIAELCTQLLHEAPAPLGQVRSGLPPGFETVVLRCLEKERDRRYTNVAELAHALTPFASSGVIYAERAGRVLTMAGIASAPLQGTAPSLSLSWNPTHIPVTQVAARAPFAVPEQSSSVRLSTPASWVKGTVSGIERSKAPLAIGVLLALGIGVGWALGARDGGDISLAPEAMTTLPVTAVAAARPAHEPTSDPHERTAAPESPPSPAQPTPQPQRAAFSKQATPRAPAAPRWVAEPPAPKAPRPASSEQDASSPERESRSSGSSETPGSSTNAWDPSTFGGRH